VRQLVAVDSDEPVLVILTSVDDRSPDWGGILAIWPELMQL